jgi:hypothetical protein
MNTKIQNKINKFLDGWYKTEDDCMFDINDYNDWMNEAVELLEEIVGRVREES